MRRFLVVTGLLALFPPVLAVDPDPCAAFAFRKLRIGTALTEVEAVKKTVKKCGLLCPDEAIHLKVEGERFSAYDDKVTDLSVVVVDGTARVKYVWVLLHRPGNLLDKGEVSVDSMIGAISAKIGEPSEARHVSRTETFMNAFQRLEVAEYSTLWRSEQCGVEVELTETISEAVKILTASGSRISKSSFELANDRIVALHVRPLGQVDAQTEKGREEARKLLD